MFVSEQQKVILEAVNSVNKKKDFSEEKITEIAEDLLFSKREDTKYVVLRVLPPYAMGFAVYMEVSEFTKENVKTAIKRLVEEVQGDLDRRILNIYFGVTNFYIETGRSWLVGKI